MRRAVMFKKKKKKQHMLQVSDSNVYVKVVYFNVLGSKGLIYIEAGYRKFFFH